MGSEVKRLTGYAARGGDVPWLSPHAIKIVGLDIAESAENWFAYCPRADEALEDEWVADIRQNGVRQPVDVYTDGDDCVMLEGRRRVRAARIVYDEQKAAKVPEAERIKVRVNIRKGDPFTLYAYNVASENRKQRTPIQRAKLMLAAQKYGADDEQVAKIFGVTKQVVKYTLALLDCAVDVQRAVDDGFPVREAAKLASLPREEQKKALGALEAAGATKGRAVAAGIEKVKKGEKVKSPTRALSPSARRRILGALRNGAREKIQDEGDRVAAEVAERVIAYLDGEKKALREWPELAEVFEEALAEKSYSKGKRSE